MINIIIDHFSCDIRGMVNQLNLHPILPFIWPYDNEYLSDSDFLDPYF